VQVQFRLRRLSQLGTLWQEVSASDAWKRLCAKPAERRRERRGRSHSNARYQSVQFEGKNRTNAACHSNCDRPRHDHEWCHAVFLIDVAGDDTTKIGCDTTEHWCQDETHKHNLQIQSPRSFKPQWISQPYYQHCASPPGNDSCSLCHTSGHGYTDVH